MDLILEAKTGQERVTMSCRGRLVGGKEADAFRHSAMLLMNGFDNLILDLAEVRAVDAGGLGSLASVLAVAMEKGRQVRIVNANKLVAQMLKATRLDHFLENGPRPQGTGMASEAAA